MAVYRVYFVDGEGRLEPGDSFYCQTDLEAVSHLHAPDRPGVRAELWQGGRFVGVAGAWRRPPWTANLPAAQLAYRPEPPADPDRTSASLRPHSPPR